MQNSNTVMWVIIIACLAWLIILIFVLRNLFYRNDIGMLLKLIWAFLILTFPLLGLVAYILIGHKTLKN